MPLEFEGSENWHTWKHYLLIFREKDRRYSFEFENEFTDMAGRDLVSRIKIYIPKSFVESAGRDQFLRLVRVAFSRMQKPSCDDPQSVLQSFRRIIRRIKRRLCEQYYQAYKNIHGFFRYFFDQLSELLQDIWNKSKKEYVRQTTYKKLQRHDDLILSAAILD